jgi:hypothetical protein
MMLAAAGGDRTLANKPTLIKRPMAVKCESNPDLVKLPASVVALVVSRWLLPSIKLLDILRFEYRAEARGRDSYKISQAIQVPRQTKTQLKAMV